MATIDVVPVSLVSHAAPEEKLAAPGQILERPKKVKMEEEYWKIG